MRSPASPCSAHRHVRFIRCCPRCCTCRPQHFGLWSGASIHEIAQVVAAAFQDGSSAGEFGTIAKLTRVTMLAPVVHGAGLSPRARSRGRAAAARKTPMPWFVLGFVALVAVNSLVTIPAAPKAAIAAVTTFLLSVALAAMGLETDSASSRRGGCARRCWARSASLFISGFSLGLIKLFA